MDEQMASVQTGAIKSLQLVEAQDKLKFDDHSYIQVLLAESMCMCLALKQTHSMHETSCQCTGVCIYSGLDVLQTGVQTHRTCVSQQLA